MLTSNTIHNLHCPYCGSGLDIECQIRGDENETRAAILRCNCQSYPIIDGIIVLRPVSRTLLEQVRDGNIELALQRALYELLPENSRRQRRLFVDSFLKIPWTPARRITDRAVDWLAQRSAPRPNESFHQASASLFSEIYADYLYHRYANPSFLAAVLLLVALDRYCPGGQKATDEGGHKGSPIESLMMPDSGGVATADTSQNFWLLDLACGVGHSSFAIQRLIPNAKVVATDHNFVNLYFSRRFLTKDALHICFDAECPLPFADAFFGAVFCLDAFHYILSKRALARELERTVAPQGLWLFPHLHNAQVPNPASGMPLPLEGYQRCFEAVQPRFFSETELLQTFFCETAVDLSVSPTEAELRRTNAFCMVGGQHNPLWQRYEDVGAFFCHDPSTLTLNPLYQPAHRENRTCLQMHWPNAWLEAECAEIKRHLPQQFELDRAVWERLTSHTPAPEDGAAIQSLAQQFLLVHLPPTY